MENLILEVSVREKMGKNACNKLRNENLTPAVVYGKEISSIPLVVNSKEIRKILEKHGTNKIIELYCGVNNEVNGKITLIREIHLDPLTSEILHLDFLQISMDKEIEVDININLTGDSVGVQSGGILQQIRRTIRVSCLPKDIPSKIDVDVSSLKIGDVIHILDLKLPDKVKALYETNFSIATVVQPKAEEEKVEEAVAKEEEAATAKAEGETPKKEEPEKKEPKGKDSKN